MNLLPGVSLVRIAIYAAIVLGLVATGARLEHSRMQKKLDKAVAEHNQFKGGVAALGHAAEIARVKQILHDLNNKERTDAEHARRTADHRRTVDRLRADADNARSRFLSAIGTASRSVEEAEKFRAKFERAYGILVQEIRGVADTGDAAVTDLDAAKDWTQRGE
jgi:hypothetical protein